MNKGDFFSQFVYVMYVAPVIAALVYGLFRSGIQGEKNTDGTVVEEPSSVVRILVLCFVIFGVPFGLYLLSK